MKRKKVIPFIIVVINIIIVTLLAVKFKNVKTTGANIKYFSTTYGTKLNIELHRGTYLAFGRESWEKGDEIVFRVSGKDHFDVIIGIIPAESMDAGYSYDDYGMIIGKTVSVTSEIQELSFIVPESGEYGIATDYIINQFTTNSGNETVNFTLEVNKKFKNPLVK